MTKIDIISGFLGAGKTTLIKKLIEQAFKGEKLVLIENEFGEVVSVVHWSEISVLHLSRLSQITHLTGSSLSHQELASCLTLSRQ